jgi:hypothetical protein
MTQTGKALSRFATRGLGVWRVVLLTLFRRQSRFLIGLYLIAPARFKEIQVPGGKLQARAGPPQT